MDGRTMNSRRRLFVATVTVAILAGFAPGSRADEFASARMADGIGAYQAQRFAEASDQFRLACFGLLDQPVVLTEGLVRLALAQEAAGRRTDVTGTLRRFLEIEKRFAGYAKGRLDPVTRTAFENLLRSRVAPDALAGVPSMSGPPAKAGGAAEPGKTP
jgi:hypothetical protein